MSHSGREEAVGEAPTDGTEPQPSRRLKRKQYDSVRSALQFLHPLLSAWLHASTASPSAAKVTEPQVERIRDLLSSGTPSTFRHSGPLSFEHVGLLRDAEWGSLVLSIVSSFPSSALSATGHGEVVNLLPIPAVPGNDSRQHPHAQESLWTDELVSRYTAALVKIHGDRPSRQLSEEGYLHEAGLLSLRVFGGGGGAATATTALEARWAALIDRYTLYMADRSHIHEIENMPQEIAIGELLMDCVSKLEDARLHPKGLDLVVDVGGGNGFLAAQVGERLGCDALVIDPFLQSHSIDFRPGLPANTQERQRPAVPRRQQLRRIRSLFEDTEWDRDIGVDPNRCALITKHLCGTAVDACLAHLERQQRLPRVLLLVPCCFGKGKYEQYINKEFLHNVLHVFDQDAYTMMGRMTDWNRSLYQQQQPSGPSDDSPSVGVRRERRSKNSAKSVSHLMPCGEALAKTVEAVLNRGRMLWLEERGYVTELREYVPACVTLKNSCVVAYRRAC